MGGGGKGGGGGIKGPIPTVPVPDLNVKEIFQAPQSPYNQWEGSLGQMAQNMVNLTNPMRQTLYDDWDKFLRPDSGKAYNPANLPAFSPLYNLSRTGLEDQYSAAREQILSGLPRGGAQGRALANLSTGRAKDVGSLQASISAPIIQDIYNKIYTTAYGTSPTQIMAGFSGAGQLANTRNLADLQSKLSTNTQNLTAGLQGQNLGFEAQKLNAQFLAAAQAQEAQAKAQSSTMKGVGMGSILGKGLSAGMPGGGSILGSAISGLGGALGGGVQSGIGSLFGGGAGGGMIAPGINTGGMVGASGLL